MAISESTRLLAPGVEVELADGKTYRLRFDFEALHVIEDEFGDIDKMVDVLNATGWKNRRIHQLSSIMVAALVHTGLSRDEIIHLLQFKDLIRYLEALTEAFNQAMPVGDDSPNSAGSGASRGNGSTGSRRALAAATKGSNG